MNKIDPAVAVDMLIGGYIDLSKLEWNQQNTRFIISLDILINKTSIITQTAVQSCVRLEDFFTIYMIYYFFPLSRNHQDHSISAEITTQ